VNFLRIWISHLTEDAKEGFIIWNEEILDERGEKNT
jgi:hypothetical protein